MNLKDFEKLNHKKFVELEKDNHIESLYSISITNNGWQWNQVFRGSLKDCNIIFVAFKKIGYGLKDAEDNKSGEKGK